MAENFRKCVRADELLLEFENLENQIDRQISVNFAVFVRA